MRINFQESVEVVPMTSKQKVFNIPYGLTIFVGGMLAGIRVLWSNRKVSTNKKLDLTSNIARWIISKMRSDDWLRPLINWWVWIKLVVLIITKIMS